MSVGARIAQMVEHLYDVEEVSRFKSWCGYLEDGMDIDGMIYYSAPTFTVGLLVKDQVIVDGPPYARKWAIGHRAREIWDQGKARGHTILWIPTKAQ